MRAGPYGIGRQKNEQHRKDEQQAGFLRDTGLLLFFGRFQPSNGVKRSVPPKVRRGLVRSGWRRGRGPATILGPPRPTRPVVSSWDPFRPFPVGRSRMAVAQTPGPTPARRPEISAGVVAHTYANGLTLLLETMPDVRSVAFSLMVPAGSAYDTPRRAGRGDPVRLDLPWCGRHGQPRIDQHARQSGAVAERRGRFGASEFRCGHPVREPTPP